MSSGRTAADEFARVRSKRGTSFTTALPRSLANGQSVVDPNYTVLWPTAVAFGDAESHLRLN